MQAEAGWGAQVLQHPASGVVVFADVNLAPEEVVGGISAHQPLPTRDRPGEPWDSGVCCTARPSFEAGMHHLECQFDFDAIGAAVAGLRRGRDEGLLPDLPYLKQAFAKGDLARRCGPSWPRRSRLGR